MAVEDANTGRRPRVTFVILSLSPLLGMEAATVALANALTTDYEVQVVLLAGDESGVPLGDSVDITSWGKPVPDWERAITLLRAFRHRNELDSDVIIVSGVWTAIPIALTLPKKLLARTLIWEHSFDRGKVTTSRDLALMQAAARKSLSARVRDCNSQRISATAYAQGWISTSESRSFLTLSPNLTRGL